jgi:hypothetical protein
MLEIFSDPGFFAYWGGTLARATVTQQIEETPHAVYLVFGQL